ncbi:MAG: CRISPR-associated protein Cmr3 [Chloroflexaceae bacterium]|nr:CRISPR-associated protein Cmr3 [Chloroflexaceae bacterium]
MPLWIIEPRDPLIVRDGRPFGPNPGARAISLPFPFPSTIAGGIRSRAGVDKNGTFDTNDSNIQRVKQIGIRGPLLIELNDTDALRWLVPAPADVVIFDKDKQLDLRRLVPLNTPANHITNLPDGLDHLVGQVCPDPRKVSRDAPRFWYWEQFKQWLLDSTQITTIVPNKLGHNGPITETRMHVSIQGDTQTASEGALFQTSGLAFTHQYSEQHIKRTRLALAVATGDPLANFNGGTGGFAPLGGERRLMNWWKYTEEEQLPGCPEHLWTRIAESEACRLVLLTPACFQNGYQPLLKTLTHAGVQPKIKAIAIQRAQVISGWDMAANNGKGAPKPTRRLAPAGTVFFLNFEGAKDKDAIQSWIQAIWMQCISDDPQDRLDGFGLAVLGHWDGKLA